MQLSAPDQKANAAASGKKLPPPAAKGGFVVNLAASTTPVTLVQPSHAALKAYTFFVSRRREDGRERFRLHMGYFESQQDAEQMLDAVRDIFPAAWAGVAPGRKLAAEAAGGKIISPVRLEVPQVRVATADARPAPAPPPATRVAPQPTPTPVPKSAQPARQAASASLDSVRAAIASLDDESREALALKQRADASTEELRLLSETQVARLLDDKRQRELVATKAGRDPAAAPIADFAGFVVQLRWSTRPIDTGELPAMAIFDAYSLYNAEGSGGAQHWYSLRLGFFNDADSARQVASYVRSEFPSATVVPVSAAERSGAQEATRAVAVARPVLPARASTSGEFRLIDDSRAPVLAAAVAKAPAQAGTAAKGASTGKTQPRTAEKAATQSAGSRRPPLTIEETLEILGANTLTLETKRGAGLSGSSSAALSHAASRRKPPQKSKLGLLFEKLAERIST